MISKNIMFDFQYLWCFISRNYYDWFPHMWSTTFMRHVLFVLFFLDDVFFKKNSYGCLLFRNTMLVYEYFMLEFKNMMLAIQDSWCMMTVVAVRFKLRLFGDIFWRLFWSWIILLVTKIWLFDLLRNYESDSLKMVMFHFKLTKSLKLTRSLYVESIWLICRIFLCMANV